MKLLLTGFVLLAVSPSIAIAQTTVGTQTPGAGNCYPFGCNSTSSSTGQDIDYFQIYNASAFTGPTSFDTITFRDSGLNFSSFVNSPVSPNLLAGDYYIRFATSTAPLGADYPIAPLSNSHDFFSGALAASNNYSSFSISGTQYDYDPRLGNLVLEVIASDQAVTPNSGANGYVQEDQSGTMTTRAFNENGGYAGPSQDGLVTTFSIGSPSAVPEPATWATMMLGFALMGFGLRRSRDKKSALYV